MLNQRQIKLKLTLNTLELPSKVECLTDQLVLQRAIYLAQEAGIHLGYYFRWYLKGPFSNELSEHIYDFGVIGNDFDHWTLTEEPEIKAKLKQLRVWFAEVFQFEGEEREKVLDLPACVHFAIKTHMSGSTEPGFVQERLKNAGRHLSLEEVNHALRILQEKGILQLKEPIAQYA